MHYPDTYNTNYSYFSNREVQNLSVKKIIKLKVQNFKLASISPKLLIIVLIAEL